MTENRLFPSSAFCPRSFVNLGDFMASNITNKKILLGITGGIAAYKSAYLASHLVKLNNEVKVIMTKSAQEFITTLTMRTLSKNKVYTDMFDGEYDLEHIKLAKWADFMIIAPATYNIIGKIANGIADDLLSSTVAAYKNKVFICPAMNDGMWNNPILKDNIEKLKKLNYIFIGPEKGHLACGDDADGRMTGPGDIIKFLDKYYPLTPTLSPEGRGEKTLQSKKILITAAATREPIDPVRFISNYSSGKMGYALAREAKQMGADVTLISGPSSETAPDDIKTIKVQTAQEMLKEVKKHFPSTNIFISCAAVSDYRPEKTSKQKIKKNAGTLNIKLTKNPDILKEISKNKNGKIFVGFAAESNDLIKNAKEKLKGKNLDYIVANDIISKDSGFESDYNKITIINKNGKIKKFDRMLKSECAKIILGELVKGLGSRV